MVRLKPDHFRVIELKKETSLNSTMVRLKLIITSSHNIDEVSQFHYGSIKTLRIQSLLLVIFCLSQFHYGSIKTI